MAAGSALAHTAGMIAATLLLALAVVGGRDPYHNQGPLAFLQKDIQKPASVKFEWQDHLLRFGSSTLILADWLTTIDGIRKGFPESNPILGRHPSVGRANTLIAAGLLTNMFVIPKLKDAELRRGIWMVMVLLEIQALHTNRRAGLQLNFRL